MRVLYHLPLSPFCRKVRLVLGEKRLPFDLHLEKVWDREGRYAALNPAYTVPTLVDNSGLTVADSRAICEYLDEAYPQVNLMGATLAERAEVRRLVAWFDEKFYQEVARNLYWERTLKSQLGLGAPDANALRAGYANLKYHMSYIGWLSEHRRWLAGDNLSVADFAAAAMLSSLDYLGDVDWAVNPAAKEWYARIKSRPAFRPLLTERVHGISAPPPHYPDLDF